MTSQKRQGDSRKSSTPKGTDFTTSTSLFLGKAKYKKIELDMTFKDNVKVTIRFLVENY